MNDKANKIYKRMENNAFDGGRNDEESVLEILEFSTLHLLCMTEDIQKDIEFYRGAVTVNGMSLAWDVLDICYIELVLDAIKHLKGSRLLTCQWRKDEEVASRAIHPYH